MAFYQSAKMPTPGVDFSYVIFADWPCRPTLSPQIRAIKLGIGERRKWIELSLWTSLSEKCTRNRPQVWPDPQSGAHDYIGDA